MPSAPAWSEAKIERLRALVKAHKSAGEIAKELKTTRAAVLGKLDRLGIMLAGGKRQNIEPRRYRRPDTPRNAVCVAKRPVIFQPTPPRRFSWQAAVDTTPEPA